MLKINDDYVIDVDELNYILKNRKINQKNGKEYFKVIGYYSNFRQAILALLNIKTIELLSSEELSLENALERITGISESLKRDVEKMFKEYEVKK